MAIYEKESLCNKYAIEKSCYLYVPTHFYWYMLVTARMYNLNT